MSTASNSAAPVAPARELPQNDWEHFRLYRDVREAIACLPIYFRTETHISGIMATDLHTLNTVLGATIEEQVVRTFTGIMDGYMEKLDDVQLCGIKTVYWREFLKTFQESTTDIEARTALERLKQRVRQATEIPSPKARSALAIISELDRLLDVTD